MKLLGTGCFSPRAFQTHCLLCPPYIILKSLQQPSPPFLFSPLSSLLNSTTGRYYIAFSSIALTIAVVSHISVTITTGCHSAGALPLWEIETRFVYLGAVRDVSKHRTPEGPWVQLGRLLPGRHSSDTQNPNTCPFSWRPSPSSPKDRAQLTSINLGWIN